MKIYQLIAPLLSKFNRPFPFITSSGWRVFSSVSFGAFVFMFLYFFQPFGIYRMVGNKFIFTMGFGVITAMVMLFNYFVLPVIFKTIFDFDRWTVSKNIIFVFWNILLITFCNWFYNSVVGHGFAVQHNLFQFLLITLGVGIFPTIFLILVMERQLFIKNSKEAKEVSLKMDSYKKNLKNNTQIRIYAENSKDFLEIYLDHLLCIISEGNYLNIYYIYDDSLKKKLIRISLKKVEKQLSEFDNIIRCHRSHIVNAQNIDRVSGNARSYNIHFNRLEFHIPVSRSFPKEMLDLFKSK